MASSSHSTESSKGYDHQFVDPIPDDLLCLICLSVARDPQQVTCCGKVYCNSCLEDHKSHSQTRIRRPLCPQCRKKFNIFADKRSKYHLEAKRFWDYNIALLLSRVHNYYILLLLCMICSRIYYYSIASYDMYAL